MNIIQNQTFDQERALYGTRDLLVRNCSFDGPADGGERLQGVLRYPGGGQLFQPALPLLA